MKRAKTKSSMKTTHFSSTSNGDLLFFLHHHHHHHHHHQKAHFPYHHLHQYVGRGKFPPPSAAVAAAEYTSHHNVLYICRSSRWDSNAESYRTNNKSDVVVNIDEEESEDSLDDNLQEFIDSLWIFKVLRSYGLMLPFIILSMLITTGPKAFLLALALPLGQSTFSYAIQKMQQEKSSSTKPRPKTKTNNKKSSDTPYSEHRNIKKKARKSRDSSNDNKDSADRNAVSYGGWDEA